MKVKNALTALAIAMSATTASAAVLDTDFIVVTDNGGLVEIGTGTASYNSSLVPMSGSFSLSPNGASADAADPNLALSVTVDTGSGSVTLTEQNDIDFDEYPLFEFFDGVLEYIDFEIVNGRNSVDLPGVAQGIGFRFTEGFIDMIADPNDQNAEIAALFLVAEEIAPVPLPAGGVLLLSALGLGAYASRKRAS